jgi:glycosyltransferase involved in cell wall biosynthesis
MFDKPLGGTELMYNELMNRVGSKYDHLSIFNYIGQADFNKTTVYWNQLSYDQQGVQWLSNPNDIDMIDHFVFVSHWQAEKYRQIFNIPGYKTHVIKNACLGVSERQAGPRDKVRLCYMSTPWRGLDVLLQAWELLKPKDAELHIFSSCKIYGPDFADSTEQHYQQLYDKCSELPNVVYRGSIPNDQLRKELHTFDILAYPNTFEETSCIAVIEAQSSYV